jgi:hypothetical protein
MIKHYGIFYSLLNQKVQKLRKHQMKQKSLRIRGLIDIKMFLLMMILELFLKEEMFLI